MTRDNEKQTPEKNHTGLIPDEQIKGSDADKAYDEDGNFGQEQGTKATDKDAAAEQKGADADRD